MRPLALIAGNKANLGSSSLELLSTKYLAFSFVEDSHTDPWGEGMIAISQIRR